MRHSMWLLCVLATVAGCGDGGNPVGPDAAAEPAYRSAVTPPANAIISLARGADGEPFPKEARAQVFWRETWPDGTQVARQVNHASFIGADSLALFVPVIFGDADGNGIIDYQDFFSLLDAYGLKEGEEGFCALFDHDGNRVVNLDDFFVFAEYFGRRSSRYSSKVLAVEPPEYLSAPRGNASESEFKEMWGALEDRRVKAAGKSAQVPVSEYRFFITSPDSLFAPLVYLVEGFLPGPGMPPLKVVIHPEYNRPIAIAPESPITVHAGQEARFGAWKYFFRPNPPDSLTYRLEEVIPQEVIPFARINHKTIVVPVPEGSDAESFSVTVRGTDLGGKFDTVVLRFSVAPESEPPDSDPDPDIEPGPDSLPVVVGTASVLRERVFAKGGPQRLRYNSQAREGGMPADSVFVWVSVDGESDTSFTLVLDQFIRPAQGPIRLRWGYGVISIPPNPLDRDRDWEAVVISYTTDGAADTTTVEFTQEKGTGDAFVPAPAPSPAPDPSPQPQPEPDPEPEPDPDPSLPPVLTSIQCPPSLSPGEIGLCSATADNADRIEWSTAKAGEELVKRAAGASFPFSSTVTGSWIVAAAAVRGSVADTADTLKVSVIDLAAPKRAAP